MQEICQAGSSQRQNYLILTHLTSVVYRRPWIRWTLKQMRYRTWGQMPLLLDRKKYLPRTKTIEQQYNRKTLSGFISLFINKIRHKQYGCIDPYCHVLMVQDTGVGVMLGGVFSWHISGTLLSIKYSLNAAICLDIVVDNVPQLLATVSPSTGGHPHWWKKRFEILMHIRPI